MKTYEFLLFDADGTLLDFDRCEEKALQDTMAHYQFALTPENMAAYHQINAALWERFNRGEIDRSFLLVDRFAQFCKRMDLPRDPAQMNRYYMDRLSEHADLLEESWEVCNILKEKYKLYIITNGASLTQHGRFAICPLTALFSDLFISEDMGVQKPQKAYFDLVAQSIPGFDPKKALVIGDSLTSDMLGANNAQLDCCWYNPTGMPADPAIHCDYEITALRQLFPILGIDAGGFWG